jgi:aryl-alcohol dehydrogenase-like predicted oxidoreductase
MVLSPGLYGSIDDVQGRSALLHAIDEGSTFVDTSDSYGSESHNEQLIGSTLQDRRDQVVISTKFGLRPPAGAERRPVQVAYATLGVNGAPELVRDYAVASLRRLRTDFIDLYSPHFPDPVVPIEETVGAMAELVREGSVRHIGLSNVTADQLERATTIHPISAVQCEWSMWSPIDPALLDVADRHGVGVVAWGPLGGGFLSGSVTELAAADLRNKFPRLSGANLALNTDRFAPIRTLAADLALTTGQLALAWLLHQHPSVIPIPGSRTATHITENIAAATLSLSSSELARIEEARALFQPAGGTIMDVATSASETG